MTQPTASSAPHTNIRTRLNSTQTSPLRWRQTLWHGKNPTPLRHQRIWRGANCTDRIESISILRRRFEHISSTWYWFGNLLSVHLQFKQCGSRCLLNRLRRRDVALAASTSVQLEAREENLNIEREDLTGEIQMRFLSLRTCQVVHWNFCLPSTESHHHWNRPQNDNMQKYS